MRDLRFNKKGAFGACAVMALGASVLVTGCSTARHAHQQDSTVAKSEEFTGNRTPASSVTVLRKLMVEAGEEGAEWLAKLLGKGPEGEALAGRVRNGLSTLKPSEIREDQKLISILSKDVLDVSADDAKYLLDVASNRAVSLANCPECVMRRKEFLGYRKVIRERLSGVAGKDAVSRKYVVGFLKRVEVLLDKDVADPKTVSALISAIKTEKFKSGDVAALLDTVQAMTLAIGKDLDPQAAAEIINNWPEASLKGLRKFYSEVVLVQASDGVDGAAAAEIVLKRLNVVEADEMKVMKVCSLFSRG
ncbi:MAG: hypothetical protein RJB38_1168 [Pseudomonadota bacterium]|jgi:hypothetical protein